MIVYRITSTEYAHDPVSGVGASLYPGRWNSKGMRMGYTASTRSLALLELLVHVDRHCMPIDRVMVPIDIPDNAITLLGHWPTGWNQLPYSPAVRAAGDAWVQSRKSLALQVPSAIVANEFSILVNPLHPRLAEVHILPSEPLVLDPRLLTLMDKSQK